MIFMIKTYSDFLTSLATLKSTDLSPGTISSEMKASEFNNLMNNIESALNTLYVKLRTLNDIHDYIKKYIQTEINDKRKEIQENLKIIEDLSDSYTNFDYITELVPFSINQNEIYDRQNNKISIMNIDNGQLIASGIIVNDIKIQDVDMESDMLPYESNWKDFKETKSLRSTYYVDEPVSSGIKENYTIIFSSPEEINYIDFDTINCNVKKIFFYDENNNIIDNPQSLYYVMNNKVSKILFTLEAKNFKNKNQGNSNSIVESISTEKNCFINSNSSSIKESVENMNDIEKIANTGLYRGKYTTWESTSSNLTSKNMITSGNSTVTYVNDNDNAFSEHSIMTSTGGVIETLSVTGYRYTPSNQVKTKIEKVEGEYIIPDIPNNKVQYDVNLKNAYSYTFGLDNIIIQKRKISECSGYISTPIIIDNPDYIKLSVDMDNYESMEFYVIDGNITTAIIPVEQEMIIKEKLISNVPIRFSVNESKKYIIYKNNEETEYNINDIEKIDLSEADYRITYYPNNGYIYTPSSEKIQIKIIQYKTLKPSEIKSVSLLKYGGDIQWTIWG